MQDRNRAGDMLVRLYDLNFFEAMERERELAERGIEIVRPLPYQFDRVVNFVSRFRTQWGEEVRTALYNSPATLFAADVSTFCRSIIVPFTLGVMVIFPSPKAPTLPV